MATTMLRNLWPFCCSALALAPLAFTAVLFSDPLDMASTFVDGLGGGALALPLYGTAGGYAVSGRGLARGRAVCGLLAFTVAPIWGVHGVLVRAPPGARHTPGRLVAVHYYSLMAILMLACSIPHRSPAQRAE